MAARPRHMEPELWVIYDHPKDYANHFVVRRWVTVPLSVSPDGAIPDSLCQLADTLEEARGKIPAGLVRLERQEGEDPCIVETWL